MSSSTPRYEDCSYNGSYGLTHLHGGNHNVRPRNHPPFVIEGQHLARIVKRHPSCFDHLIIMCANIACFIVKQKEVNELMESHASIMLASHVPVFDGLDWRGQRAFYTGLFAHLSYSR